MGARIVSINPLKEEADVNGLVKTDPQPSRLPN
jgi:hypothetical protein